MTRNKNQAGVFLAGVLVGGVLGSLVSLLVTPRSGKDTRQLVKKTAQALPDLAEDVASSVQFQAHRLSESARRNWEGTLGRLKEALAAGIEASQKEAQEVESPDELPSSPNSVDNSS